MPLSSRFQTLKIGSAIRDNLKKYPESKIFREIVQNSEDANANKVIIKLDTNYYGTKTLFNKPNEESYEKLCCLQGPSVLIYNNGVFSDKDWEGIEYISEGSKKKDMLSIGNFGLGFNSVYHITDCPVIVSGKKIWFLDPLKLVGGLEMDFTEPDCYQNYEDQFKPFEYFGCDMKSYFNGTIIRLPLRLKGNEIKEKPLTIGECTELLYDFYNEISEIPIFLKVISSISLFINDKLLSNIEITNQNEISERRQKISKKLNTIVKKEMKDPSNNDEFNEIISRNNQDDFKTSYKIDMKILKYSDGIIGEKEISFIVSQGIFISDKLKRLVNGSNQKLISYGGAAIPIKKDGSYFDGEFIPKPFTFLPIGSKRIGKIPAHIFGYYVLTDARNDVYYSSSSNNDQSQEYKNNEWNHFISKEVVPFFYNEAMKEIKNHSINLHHFFPYVDALKDREDLTPEIDISIYTMNNYVMKNQYFQDYFDSSSYHKYDEFIILKNNTQQFIIDYLQNSSYKSVQLENGFIEYLYNNKCSLDNLISPLKLSTILQNKQLTNFNQDILDYLCSDKNVITKGLLSNLNLLPYSENGLKSLRSFAEFFIPNFDFIVSNGIEYSLLKNLKANLQGYLDVTKFGNGDFIRNIDLILNHYENIKKLDISIFLNSLSNNQNLNCYYNDIWNVIVKFYPSFNNSSYNAIISCLNIFTFKNDKSNIYMTNFNDPKTISNYQLKIQNNEIIIFKKLGFQFIEKNEKVDLFLQKNDTKEFSIKKILTQLVSLGSFEHLISSDEIIQMRNYLFGLIYEMSENEKILFFSIKMHPCIGNQHFKFSSINYYSTCILFKDINEYEIMNLEIINVNDYIYRGFNLPTLKFYCEHKVYLEYLLPNISKFDHQKSIKIIKDFVYTYIYTPNNLLSKNDINKYNWILAIDNSFININSFYYLSGLEKEIFNIIQPQYVINESIKDVMEILYQKYLISYLDKNFVAKLTINYLQSNSQFNEKLYQLFLKYLSNFNSQEFENLLNIIKTIKFIPSSLVETFEGYQPKDMRLSISEITISEHKELKFSVKFPIILQKDSTLYKYLENDIDPIYLHWFNLIKIGKSINNINLEEIFKTIYKYLSSKIITETHLSEIAKIESIGIIWYKEKFIQINRLFKDGVDQFEPFYYKLEFGNSIFSILNNFKTIKKKLELADYYLILKEIKNINDIDKEHIKIYVECLKVISKENLKETQVIENIKYLPTVNDELMEFKKVVYSDRVIQKNDFYQLNKSIDLLTVEKLYILKQSNLNQNNYALKGEFGQKEELVTRLKSILYDYKVEGSLNELIQNASDAKAKDFKIIYDNNKYENDNIALTLKSNECQDLKNYLNQSLLVYNNSVFKDEDITNIQNLGFSHKRKDKSSIGKFGLGVNTAYNFSNTITILSGKYLMILDPLIRTVPLSENKSPGAIYKISEFEDSREYFEPFIHYKNKGIFSEIDFEKGYFNGTLFRLPLCKNIGEFNICKASWNSFKIMELFKEYQNNNIHNCMLFTNIESFEIGEIDGIGYKVQYKVIKENSKTLQSQPYSHSLMSIPMKVIEENYSIINTKKEIEKKRFIIGTSVDFTDNIKFINCIPNENRIHQFLSKYKSEEIKPYGGIAFEISTINNSVIQQQSKSFVYLPYKNIDLPFHVNGNFAINTSRDILETTKSLIFEMKDPLKEKLDDNVQLQETFSIYWNTLLIEDLITPIFLNTLMMYKYCYILSENLIDEIQYMEIIKKYYSLFPDHEYKKNSSIFDKLMNQFNIIINKKEYDLYIQHSLYESEVYNKSFYFLFENDIGSFMNPILKLVSNYGLIYLIPNKLCNQKFEQNIIKPELLANLISNQDLPNEVLSNEEDLFIIFFYLFKINQNTLLSSNCQLLKLNNGKIVKTNNNESYLFNQEYYDLIKDNSAIETDQIFIDKKFSEKINGIIIGTDQFKIIKILEQLKLIKIVNLTGLEFFFKIILPKYLTFSIQQILNNLNFLIKQFSHSDQFSPCYTQDQYKTLKNAPILPYKDKEDSIKFKSIQELYSFRLKKLGFEVLYPLDEFNNNKWEEFLDHFGIKNDLEKHDIINEFKRINREFYGNMESNNKMENLKERTKYLWKKLNLLNSIHKKSEYIDIFDTIKELNIVPTSKCVYYGSFSQVPILGQVKNCYKNEYEDLLFTIKYKSELIIEYPDDSIYFTNQDVFKNLYNLFKCFRGWELQSSQSIEKYYELITKNCQYLEGKLRNKEVIEIDDSYHSEPITLLPVIDSEPFQFENVIFENSIVPFFYQIPSFYSQYKLLFKLLGCKNIQDPSVIINRINQFLNQTVNDTQFKRIHEHLCNIYINDISTIPFLTNINILKPYNQVMYVDDQMIYNRINLDGIFWKVNDLYNGYIDYWKIHKLSKLVIEEINFKNSIFNEFDSNEFEIFNKEIKQNQEFLQLVPFNNKIHSVEIKIGKVVVKTILLNNNQDISNNKETPFFYDSVGNKLYIKEDYPLLKTLEQLFAVPNNKLEELYKSFSNKNDKNKKIETKETHLALISEFNNKNNNNSTNNSGFYKQIAIKKKEIANLLFSSSHFDEVLILCYGSIEHSIKSVLELNNISYNTHNNPNVLKQKTYYFNSLRELTRDELNLDKYKTSLNIDSNREKAISILDLAESYLNILNTIVQ